MSCAAHHACIMYHTHTIYTRPSMHNSSPHPSSAICHPFPHPQCTIFQTTGMAGMGPRRARQCPPGGCSGGCSYLAVCGRSCRKGYSGCGGWHNRPLTHLVCGIVDGDVCVGAAAGGDGVSWVFAHIPYQVRRCCGGCMVAMVCALLRTSLAKCVGVVVSLGNTV